MQFVIHCVEVLYIYISLCIHIFHILIHSYFFHSIMNLDILPQESISLQFYFFFQIFLYRERVFIILVLINTKLINTKLINQQSCFIHKIVDTFSETLSENEMESQSRLKHIVSIETSSPHH